MVAFYIINKKQFAYCPILYWKQFANFWTLGEPILCPKKFTHRKKITMTSWHGTLSAKLAICKGNQRHRCNTLTRTSNTECASMPLRDHVDRYADLWCNRCYQQVVEQIAKSPVWLDTKAIILIHIFRTPSPTRYNFKNNPDCCGKIPLLPNGHRTIHRKTICFFLHLYVTFYVRKLPVYLLI